MRRPLPWLLGGFAVLGFLRRRREAPITAGDPRAAELRRKLAESRSIVEERDEFEAAELAAALEQQQIELDRGGEPWSGNGLLRTVTPQQAYRMAKSR